MYWSEYSCCWRVGGAAVATASVGMAEGRSPSVASDSSCLGQDTSAVPVRVAAQTTSKGSKPTHNGKKDVKKKAPREPKLEPNTPDAAPVSDDKTGVCVRSNGQPDAALQGPSVYSQMMAHLNEDKYSTPVRCVTPVRSHPAAKPRKGPGKKGTKAPPPRATAADQAYDAEPRRKNGDRGIGNDEHDVGSLDVWLSEAGIELDGAKMRQLLIVWQLAQQYQARKRNRPGAEKNQWGKPGPAVAPDAKELESKLDSLMEQVECARKEIRDCGAPRSSEVMPTDALNRLKSMETMVSKTRRDVKLIGAKVVTGQAERLEASSLHLKEAARELMEACSGRQTSEVFEGVLKETVVEPVVAELTEHWSGEFAKLREDVRVLRKDNKKIREEVRSLKSSHPEKLNEVLPICHTKLQEEIKELKTALAGMQQSLDGALARLSQTACDTTRELGLDGHPKPKHPCDGGQNSESKSSAKGDDCSTIGIVQDDGDGEVSTGSINNELHCRELTSEAVDNSAMHDFGHQTPRSNFIFKNDLFNDPVPERTEIRSKAAWIPAVEESLVQPAAPVTDMPAKKVEVEHAKEKCDESEECERMLKAVNEIVKEVEVEVAGAGVQENEQLNDVANKETPTGCFGNSKLAEDGHQAQALNVTVMVVATPKVVGTVGDHCDSVKVSSQEGGKEGTEQVPIGLLGNVQDDTSVDRNIGRPDTGEVPLGQAVNLAGVEWPVDNASMQSQGVGVDPGATTLCGDAKDSQSATVNQGIFNQVVQEDCFVGVDQSMASEPGELTKLSHFEQCLLGQGVVQGYPTAGPEFQAPQQFEQPEGYENEEEMVDEVSPPNSEGGIFGQVGPDKLAPTHPHIFAQVGAAQPSPIASSGIFNQMGGIDPIPCGGGEGMFGQIGKETDVPNFGLGFFGQHTTDDKGGEFRLGPFGQDNDGDQSSDVENDIFSSVGKGTLRMPRLGEKDTFGQFAEDDKASNFGQNLFDPGSRVDQSFDMGSFAEPALGKENRCPVRESTDTMLCDEEAWPNWSVGGSRTLLQNANSSQPNSGGSCVDATVEMDEQGEAEFDDKGDKKGFGCETMATRIPTWRNNTETDGHGFPRYPSKLRPPTKTAFDVDDSSPRTP